jgi:phage-related holin
MTVKTYINLLITTIGTNIILLLGGWDKLLNALVVFVVIDYLTGVAKGYKNKKLNSYIGFKG